MAKQKPKPDIHWLPDEQYNKALFQLNSAIWKLLNRQYNMCGYNADGNAPVARELVKLAEDFALRCRGVDKAIVYHDED